MPGHQTLILGIGNADQADDAVGCVVAQRVRDWGLPTVQVQMVRQVTPEMVDWLSGMDRVVFVDACVGQPEPMRLRPLSPAISLATFAHAYSPEWLLALAAMLAEPVPEAWLVTIRAEALERGQTRSAQADAGIEASLHALAELLAVPR